MSLLLVLFWFWSVDGGWCAREWATKDHSHHAGPRALSSCGGWPRGALIGRMRAGPPGERGLPTRKADGNCEWPRSTLFSSFFFAFHLSCWITCFALYTYSISCTTRLGCTYTENGEPYLRFSLICSPCFAWCTQFSLFIIHFDWAFHFFPISLFWYSIPCVSG